MKKISCQKQFRLNESGSALVMAMAAAGFIAMTGFAAMQVGSYLNKGAQIARENQDLSALAHAMTSLVSNAEICRYGADGIAGASLNGLQFEDANGNVAAFNATAAASADGQTVRLGTNFTPSQGNAPFTIRSGTRVEEFNTNITRLYIRAAPHSTLPLTYVGQLLARIDSGSNVAMNEKALVDIMFEVDGAGSVVKCGLNLSSLTPQSMCSAMGCTYDPAAVGQKCICPLPTMSCAAGQYIKGIDPTTMQPVCATVNLGCPAGNYLAAIDPRGNPVCSSVTYTVVAPPPPPPVNGGCGGANSGTFADATAANSAGLCSAGAASPASLAGTGPWNWTCNGSNGGTNASCMASATAAPPPPPPSPSPAACQWTRIAGNDVEGSGVSNIARLSPVQRGLQVLNLLLGSVPEAGACVVDCDLFNPGEYMPKNMHGAPQAGFVLSETFGGPIPPAPSIGSVETNSLCTSARNGQTLAGLHHNSCTCRAYVTSTWRCDCP